MEAATTTDSLGNFLLDLPPGPGYRLSVEQLGYLSTGFVVLASDFHLPVMICLPQESVHVLRPLQRADGSGQGVSR